MEISLTEEQIERYSRQIILPQIGGKGQKRLLKAKVFVVGAGGLGSIAAMYLAAAGIGKIGIIDFDRVELSNLHRQLLHHTHDVGRPKVVSAAEAIADINPDVEVVPYLYQLTADNIMDIIVDYDVIVDGTDNFPTRYLVNDACVLAKKPSVHGSILFVEGTATLFLPNNGCYRCLFPTPPPPGIVPSCAEGGVLGILPGIIGLIQAVETIKVILDLGHSLTGRLLVFDALDMEFQELKWHRNPKCPVCGDSPTITHLLRDYGQTCAVPTSSR